MAHEPSDDVGKEITRPHTSLGLARMADEAIHAGGTNSAEVGATLNLADLKASWTMSGAGSTDALEEPAELKASRYDIFRGSAMHDVVD